MVVKYWLDQCTWGGRKRADTALRVDVPRCALAAYTTGCVSSCLGPGETARRKRSDKSGARRPRILALLVRSVVAPLGHQATPPGTRLTSAALWLVATWL